MNIEGQKRATFLAIVGCLLIGLFFWMSSRSRVIELLEQEVPKSEILSMADQAYNNSTFVYYEMRRSIELGVDNSLLHYAQKYLDNENRDEFLPIGEWNVRWEGETQTKEEGTQPVVFSLTYDFEGNLIGMIQDAPELKMPPNLGELEARIEARRFLRSQNIETDDLRVDEPFSSKSGGGLRYDFSFTRTSSISNDLLETYQVTIIGQNITEYRARLVVNPETFEFPESERTSELGAIVGMLVTWAFLALLLIAMFFKRLRQDVLEFKRAFWIGVIVFVLMFTYIGLSNWPDWITVFAGGGGAGVVAGLSFLMIYSVTDSLNRDVWRERLALSDVLFNGFFRVREFGGALLFSIFLAGGFLTLLAGLYWLSTELNIGHLTFDEEVFWIFQDGSAILPNVCKNVLQAFFVTFILFSFCLSYLRSKLNNTVAFVIFFGLIINIAGFSLYYLRASYFGFFLFLPIAVLCAYCVYRFDLITVLLTTFLVNLFLETLLISLVPSGVLSPPGLTGLSFVFIMLVTGTYFLHSKTSVRDFQEYVPSYVSRIAERERFLKELEIAQNVQQRFLPQSVPYFPNLEIASLCRPALEVGGDYYDFICGGDKWLGVVIGDVSGKGVSAAFYMTMVKGIIKTLAKTSMSPKELLTRMNAIFYENAPNNVFISMIYGLFDLENNTLTIARAGHNPVIFRTSQGDMLQMLNPKGLAIGLEKGNIFSQTIEEISLSLSKGDTFLFFTDGISESMNTNGDEFGEERLRQIVHLNGECSAKTLMTKITTEVEQFAGEVRQHDDLTMVIVRIGES